MGLLLSRYRSCPAWSCRSLLTRLCVGSLFYGIHHTWHGLVVIFSHARGLVVLVGFGGRSAGHR